MGLIQTMSETSQEAKEFAERYHQEQKEWRQYQRNRSAYDGDWGELVSELNDMFK